MNNWSWHARDKAKVKRPTIVESPTYVGAQVRACHHFGFVMRHPNGDYPQVWKVEVEVAR